MKKIFLVAVVLVITIVMVAVLDSNNVSQDFSADESILYDSVYEYTDSDKKFLLKERGYDFSEEFNGEDIRVMKKEILVSFQNESLSDDNLYYEIYQNNGLAIRGIMNKENNYYYSLLKFSNMAALDKNITVKILNSNNELLYEFNVEGEDA